MILCNSGNDNRIVDRDRKSTMENQVNLIEDRLEDLEEDLIKLSEETDTKKTKEATSQPFKASLVVMRFFPIIIAFIILLGLDFNYQSSKSKISYNGKGLIEITLIAITTFSGGYMAKKYSDNNE